MTPDKLHVPWRHRLPRQSYGFGGVFPLPEETGLRNLRRFETIRGRNVGAQTYAAAGAARLPSKVHDHPVVLVGDLSFDRERVLPPVILPHELQHDGVAAPHRSRLRPAFEHGGDARLRRVEPHHLVEVARHKGVNSGADDVQVLLRHHVVDFRLGGWPVEVYLDRLMATTNPRFPTTPGRTVP